jgi:hypothetical protein
MAQIRGQAAEDNDNDPVEMRKYQILGSDLNNDLGGIPTSPIWYRGSGPANLIFWQYFPNGIIISSPDSCACVIYGPIYNYWDQTGQFDGPLGAPLTDVLRLPSPPAGPGQPPPPPGAAYAIFQHGALYLDPDINATVVQLSPVTDELVQSASGIAPNGDGVAAAVRDKVQAAAEASLNSDQRLHDEVASISTSASFNSTGQGGCAGAGFNAVGRSLLRTHIINVHLDFQLRGCAGSVGGATADLRLELRLFIDPPSVAGRMVNYWIDSVASPFGAGNQDIRDQLLGVLNAQFGKDQLNTALPTGITVLGGIVEPNGDVHLFIAPICAATNLMRGDASGAQSLVFLKNLRDRVWARQVTGRAMIETTAVFGPALIAALGNQADGRQLRGKINRALARIFSEGADLKEIDKQLDGVKADLKRLLSHPELRRQRGWPDRLVKRAVQFARDELDERASLAQIAAKAGRLIHEEIHRLDDRDAPGRRRR